jgi:hypothetical protein
MNIALTTMNQRLQQPSHLQNQPSLSAQAAGSGAVPPAPDPDPAAAAAAIIAADRLAHANMLSERMEAARKIVLRDLLNRQEAAKTYSVVSALFATLPSPALLLFSQGGLDSKGDALRAACGITSLWSVCATIGYTLQLLLIGDWIQLLEMKASPRAISESRFQLDTLVLWRATEWLFRGSLLGLIGIFVVSSFVTMTTAIAHKIALFFAVATGVCSLWMVFILFPRSARALYEVRVGFAHMSSSQGRRNRCHQRQGIWSPASPCAQHVSLTGVLMAHDIQLAIAMCAMQAKHKAATPWEDYTESLPSTIYSQWELFIHGYMCGPLPGVVKLAGSLLPEPERQAVLRERAGLPVPDPNPPVSPKASAEVKLKNWDPRGKTWSEWNVRSTTPFSV